jgi:hypothetical protein
MNCRIGDLARVVRAALPCNQGIVVEVLRPDGRAHWIVRPVKGPRPTTDGARRPVGRAADAALRPLRGMRK